MASAALCKKMLTFKHLSSSMFMSLVGMLKHFHTANCSSDSAGRHAATDAGSEQKTHANESDEQLAVWKCFNMSTKLMNINDDR